MCHGPATARLQVSNTPWVPEVSIRLASFFKYRIFVLTLGLLSPSAPDSELRSFQGCVKCPWNSVATGIVKEGEEAGRSRTA